MPRSPYFSRMSAHALLTAEELLRINLPNKRSELVRGKLMIREPAGYIHGAVAARLLAAIAAHIGTSGLGRVFAAETGFTLARGPDTVRAPDVAFVSAARLPRPAPRGYAELAPDLAAEVLSPDDSAPEVLDKVADWLRAGTRLVWVVDPARRVARVYCADGSEDHIAEADVLRGEDVLPAFALELASLFGDV
jgi:Uma2 family endonuclease